MNYDDNDDNGSNGGGEAASHVVVDPSLLLVPFVERPHFVYQYGRWFEGALRFASFRHRSVIAFLRCGLRAVCNCRCRTGAWLYEMDGPNAELRRLPTYHAEPILVRTNVVVVCCSCSILCNVVT